MYIFKYILVIFCFWKYIFTFTGSKQQTCKHSKLITGLGSLPTGRGLAVISVRCWECDKKMTENWYNKFWHIILVTSHNVFMSYSASRGIFQLYLVINIGCGRSLGEVTGWGQCSVLDISLQWWPGLGQQKSGGGTLLARAPPPSNCIVTQRRVWLSSDTDHSPSCRHLYNNK